MKVTPEEILSEIRSLSDPEAVQGMARFGINPDNTLGVSIPNLLRIAKKTGKDHDLAQELWESGIHEARILAAFIDIPKLVTEARMEDWVKDFDSWDVCDQVCIKLFNKTAYAYDKAIEWSGRDEVFVKRAGFALMATLAVHDKKAADQVFIRFLQIINDKADDNRNFVKKAINWALRQIGKRNPDLNRAAISTAQDIQSRGSKAGKWIAADALKELTGDKVREKLGLI
ncbi:MAG TPA: DNA alkylation repair protein [Desulfitobacteriaceae bacterium]|jgi:3-methyladenine DNA glycosylase AlkD|nr:DNA alkylation repair protein [Desulfitobacteriaceae bacterium]